MLAIQAASQAFHTEVPQTSPGMRSSWLFRWHDLILEHLEDLSVIISLESGKPLAEARDEVRYGASYFQFYAGETLRQGGFVIPSIWPHRELVARVEPKGVAAIITPFNFPFAMLARKVAPALGAGCPVVMKPAEDTPLSALALTALGLEAGVPPRLISTLTASRETAAEIGQTLAESTEVAKVSFTGSSEVGQVLLAASAESHSIKSVSLECGGNAPFLVMDDADVSAAVEGALASKFRNAGQTCIASNRFYVAAKVHDAFVTELEARIQSEIRLGGPFGEGTTMGPLIHARARNRVQTLVSQALAQGATCVSSSFGAREDLNGSSNYMSPTVLTDIQPESELLQQEIFGPVVPIVRCENNEEEAMVALANDSTSGLAAYVYTRDVGRVSRMTRQLQVGMVGVNCGNISAANVPFGGVKHSGIGREGSIVGMSEYTNLKYICTAGLDS